MKKVLIAASVAGLFAALTSCASGEVKMITKGDSSKLDTLSYSVGLNLASMIKYQVADLPLDMDVLVTSLIASANGTNEVAQEDAQATLQDYFQTKRSARAAEVNKTRDEADSVALANGASAETVAEARQNMPADASMFESEEECALVSAAMGNDLGHSLISANIPIQTIWVEQAFADTEAEEAKMTDAEANAKIQEYFTVTMPEQNRKAAEEWMASIEKKSGVKKTESGILYKVEKEGDAALMATNDQDVVKVKYTGKTRNGEVFDSSRYEDMEEDRKEYIKSQNNGELPEDGEIIEFPLNRVIPGWTEGMKLVGKGGRISLWIPSDLAYGARGAGGKIGPNEALYFDVELVDVVPFVEPAPAAEEAVSEE